MITCKQVSKALADHHYWELPALKRWGLKLHVALCVMCGKYNRQVMDLQDGMHRFLEHEEQDDVPSSVTLSEQARDRIAHALQEARRQD